MESLTLSYFALEWWLTSAKPLATHKLVLFDNKKA